MQAEQTRNDKAKSVYQKLLNGKLITQAEYNVKVAALDADLDKKKQEIEQKQFKRNQAIQISNALINAAAGSIKLWIDPGFPWAIPLQVLLAAQTLAQIGVIASQKPPQYAKGGVAHGAKHSEGGIQMVDSKTGNVVGEMEGNEPYMILSGNTYKNNKGVVDSLLYNSLYRNGATIEPAYFNTTYKPVAAKSIVQSFQTIRHFASGGVINTSSPAPVATTDPALIDTLNANQQMIMMLAGTVNKLEQRLSKPIPAEVSLKQLDTATETRDRIRRNASFNY